MRTYTKHKNGGLAWSSLANWIHINESKQQRILKAKLKWEYLI